MEKPSPYPVSAHYRQPHGQPQPPSGSSPIYPPPRGQFSGGQSQTQGYGQPVPIPQGIYPPHGQVVTHRAPQAKPRLGLMASGSMLALAALVITPKLSQSQVEERATPFTCIKQEQATALVSRDQLKRLLETDLESPKGTVREFLQQPYCVLSPGQTQAGQPADREAYPLEFDPQTWLVVLYEGDRYAGYDFRFR